MVLSVINIKLFLIHKLLKVGSFLFFLFFYSCLLYPKMFSNCIKMKSDYFNFLT